MQAVIQLIKSNEDWLMERILMYAEKTGYTAYTSTLKEAWRLSISGLSKSIIIALKQLDAPPEFNPEYDFVSDPIAQFGVLEAQLHRKRGISLSMFMGLFKYYRQSYVDLLETVDGNTLDRKTCTLFVNRIFDIIEISFCTEWLGIEDDQVIIKMQKSNRDMTNEKNRYLTIFESIPNPIFLIGHDGVIQNMNAIASNSFTTESVAGGHYYHPQSGSGQNDTMVSKKTSADSEMTVFCLLPWLQKELQDFKEGKLEQNPFIKETTISNKDLKFNVQISAMLDVSHKFEGMILILEDITKLAAAEKEVKKLAGLIPICSYCKNIRDDKGYWNQLEKYIQDHSEVEFSHGICQECAKKYYPDLDIFED
ncbi:MAG: hypothetical protein KKD01_17400 [Proteobacteria bacterium]|nr:hypothetical protein [Pseudomonadota bacterium]MBU1417760.1 hypothetical protein [Pseudomonadota bacterium]MBU1456502.1 hypothetical protein [Pseudomonadota bacterium]